MVWYVEVVGKYLYELMIKGCRYNPNNLACCQMVYGLDISNHFYRKMQQFFITHSSSNIMCFVSTLM